MKMKSSEQGSVVVIVVIIIAILAGGTAAYFLTDGFGSKKSDTTHSIEKTIEDTKPTDKSKNSKVVPSNMPSDMPVFQPSEIITSSNSDNGGFRLGLNTQTAEAEVISWYMGELGAAGWQPEQSIAMENMINFSKGDFSGSITIVKFNESKGTTISYIADKK